MKKIDLKKHLSKLLSMKAIEEYESNLTDFGIDIKRADNAMVLMSILLKKALSGGEISAIKEIMSIVRETDDSTGNGEIEKLIKGLKQDDLQQ